MVVIVERKAPDIDYRKHGINMVGSPPAVLVRGGDETGAQLNTAHCQICIPAMRTSKWKFGESILKVPTGKRGILAPEWSRGSPGTGFNQI